MGSEGTEGETRGRVKWVPCQTEAKGSGIDTETKQYWEINLGQKERARETEEEMEIQADIEVRPGAREQSDIFR